MLLTIFTFLSVHCASLVHAFLFGQVMLWSGHRSCAWLSALHMFLTKFITAVRKSSQRWRQVLRFLRYSCSWSRVQCPCRRCKRSCSRVPAGNGGSSAGSARGPTNHFQGRAASRSTAWASHASPRACGISADRADGTGLCSLKS